MTKHIQSLFLLATASTVVSVTSLAVAQPGGLNLQSSEYRRIHNLPRRGEPARIPWVGYWWSYSSNGIASRYRGSEEPSPAEKMDQALGRVERLDMAALDAHIDALEERVHPLEEERRDVVKTLNQKIARGEDYRSCSDFPDETAACIADAATTCACPWNRYQELASLIREAKRDLPAVTIDTATEFEHMNHGNGVAGVEGWWGHCNAWAAASILEPEPVREAEVDGQRWRVGDVKALLTESYMEVHSAFYGSRVGEDHSGLAYAAKARVRELVGTGKSENEILDVMRTEFAGEPESAVREYASYFRAWNDVTPADFHILFSVYLGKLERAFVIDRFTGSEVWNQPVTEFSTEVVEELAENDQGLYPVVFKARFEWATDGVAGDATNESEGTNAFHDRHVTYTLYLDKPLSDTSARIVGPGKWEHAASEGSHAHPDFIWVPTADAPAVPRSDGTYYENPYVSLAYLHDHVLPAVIAESGGGGSELAASEAPNAAIPDYAGGAAGLLERTLVIAGAGLVDGVTVAVKIRHTYRGDLAIALRHGDKEVVLREPAGGGQDDLEVELSSEAFRGLDAAGEWTLIVRDTAGEDVGTLERWSVAVGVTS